MKYHRIYGLILRYTYLLRRNFDRLTDSFYWPIIDLLLWGLTGLYIEKIAGNVLIIKMIISGLVLWYIVYRTQSEITVNLLEEFWNENLVNLFVSPLTFWEWIMAVLINGIIKAFVTFIFAALVAFVLYHISVFSYGFYLIPFMFSLLLTGWFIGLFIAGFIFRYGTKIQTLAWTLVYIISPFSAVFYPVSILPVWAQYISVILPTSYVFEGLREVIQKGHFDPSKLWISLGLNVIYLTLALIYINSSFKKALDRGLINIF